MFSHKTSSDANITVNKTVINILLIIEHFVKCPLRDLWFSLYTKTYLTSEFDVTLQLGW